MKILDRSTVAILIFMIAAYAAFSTIVLVLSFFNAESRDIILNDTNCRIKSHMSRPSCWPQSEWEALRENMACIQSGGNK